ncbi:unnamed protein product [Dovyalis caffra]|uniref:Sulfotransferase n=1 Tax=Dovyalis caffra TaxID=77055 RepID=A0AAV1RNH3_9ROSI|nr:unnamed protein product [Dovyalis caffra]
MEKSLSCKEGRISETDNKELVKEENEQGKEKTKQKHQALISSLPKRERGDMMQLALLQYQGFWLGSEPALKGILFMQDHFKARPTDIVLASLPKCGTTWLKALIFTIINRADYDFPTHPLLTANPHDLVTFLEGYLAKHESISGLGALPSPRLLATHCPYTLLPNSMINNSGCRFVYVCRDPKDVVISTWHFVNKLLTKPRPLEDAFEQFCEGVSPFGPFWDHVIGYWRASLELPEKMLFLKYEDLKRDPFVHVKRLAEFLGQPFTQDEENDGMVQEIIKLCSFENLSNLEINKSSSTATRSRFKNSDFFRKGEAGDWEKYLTTEMAAALDHKIKEKLHDSGLTFTMPL